MPRPPTAMRKIREVLRLTFGEALSRRQVAAALHLPRATVTDHVARASRAGLGWPLPEGLDDDALEARLFRQSSLPLAATRPLPDWPTVHHELHRTSVTLQLLHYEYKAAHPTGYQYSQFCRLYRAWQRHIDLPMRQEHRAGEKCFLDFPGDTLPIVDPATGVVRQAQLFVGVLGASNYTYAEAVSSQSVADWVTAHVHMLEFFGSVPAILVPDNLAAGVTRAHRYEPIVNRTYEELAAHYGCVVIPGRPRRPRDKAKVEQGVLLAERWVLAALRNRTFFSLSEANQAIRERLAWLNERPFKKLDGCRRSLFETLDRPAMRPLPAERYEYAAWKTATVNVDDHVEVERHSYSVPYALVGQRCDVRVSAATVEIFCRGRRVASHLRSGRHGHHTTEAAHMPAAHRRYAEWTPSRIVRWATQTGPATAAVAGEILRSRPHPEQGFRSCLGILRLSHRYGPERLEAACARALAVRGFSYRSVESILKCGLDQQPLPGATPDPPVRQHENLRGATYYE